MSRVVVIGGGPGGHAAALAAAAAGADVVVVEAEDVGGQCVHQTCIPTGLMLSAVVPHVDALELGVMGVFDLGDELRLGRAGARRDALVKKLASGMAVSLTAAGVRVVEGRARLASPTDVVVGAAGGDERLEADAVVVATGARWDPPRLPGVPDRLVVTGDAVVRLDRPPSTAVVVGGGSAATAFVVESAFLLLAAGTDVTFAAPGPRVVEALDGDVDVALVAALEAAGMKVHLVARVEGDGDGGVSVGGSVVRPDLVVAPDDRHPNTGALGLDALGVAADPWITVDHRCATSVPSLYAVGDVTGGAMLTAAAVAGGRVAGTNAAGGDATLRPVAHPHVLHTSPQVAWVGPTEVEARATGHDVVVGIVDLSWSARAVTLGGREGVAKLVAERELGQVLGVHVVGPEAAEVAAVAATAVQAELTVEDLAAAVHWHPSAAESLGDAARQAVAGMGAANPRRSSVT